MCSYTGFSTPFVEKTVLFLFNGLGSLIKNHLARYARVSFWALFPVLLIYVSLFVLVPHYFDFYSFGVYLKMWDCNTSTFVLLSQDCFGFYCATQILGDLFYFCEKYCWNFDRGCMESVDWFGHYGHFNNINSSNP